MSDIVEQLANAESAYLIAAAGCGKTYSIAQAVAKNAEGCQLILTHTHAGVQAIKKHLQRTNISQKHYHVETIAAWTLGLATRAYA